MQHHRITTRTFSTLRAFKSYFKLYCAISYVLVVGLIWPLNSLSEATKTQQAISKFITTPIQTTIECLQYDCKRNKVPDVLLQAQNNCEMEKIIQKCDQITNANPEDAKYIRSCTIENLCQRHLAPEMGLKVSGCLRGAADVYKDYAAFFQQAADKLEDAIDDLKKKSKNELEKCMDLSCKRKHSRGVPEFDKMSDANLAKYPIVYIDTRVKSYQAYASGLNREDAHRTFVNENVGLKEYLKNQKIRESRPSIETAYIQAGKNFLKKSGIILECYDPQAYTEILCQGIIHSALPGVALKGGVMTIRSVASAFGGVAERRGWTLAKPLSIESERSLFRQLFSEKNFMKTFTTKAENAAYMKAAESSIPKAGQIFVRIENSLLKYLNTEIGDKVLITSINNKYNEILFRRIEELKKKFPTLEINPYQGFKEVEFRIATPNGQPIPDGLMKEVDLVFQSANKEIKNHLEVNSILRASDSPDDWYRAGVGRTGDMANVAARESRDLPGNALVSFDDPRIVAKLEASIQEGKGIANDLVKQFSGSELVSSRDGIASVNAEVMGIVRKHSNVVDLSDALRAKYPGQNITEETAGRLKKLYEIQDRFSPPVRFAERKLASFTSGRGTQVGVDFVNAGGANAEGQMRALLNSSNSSSMLSNSRDEFVLATKELNRKKQLFRKINEDLVSTHNAQLSPGSKPLTMSFAESGDDGVVEFSEVLTQKQKDWIASEWASREKNGGRASSSARITIPKESITNVVQKNILASDGEKVEKSFRQLITSKLENKTLDDIIVKVEMKGLESGKGYIDLNIASSSGKPLTSDQIRLIRQKFEESIKEVNSNAGGGGKLRYRPGETRIISD